MNGHGGDGGGFVPRNPDEALQYTPFTSVVPLRTGELGGRTRRAGDSRRPLRIRVSCGAEDVSGRPLVES